VAIAARDRQALVSRLQSSFSLMKALDSSTCSFMTSRFDPRKDAINQARHGLSLEFGDRIFEDENHIIIPSIRPDDHEERFKVVGLVGDKLFTGVFTWRDDLARFISVRRSNKNEERAYHSG